ncbi:hypothetical protein GYMLUDRAFT_204967 [Collybiopsis luxurians FD-317 M1]|uniref:Mitochondrial group I intron splicing factor CCM1 n=1 Tax=Collybiopsis luxurians FD-317 M1 TaxID=944289 RepID=A0A0D0AZC6_9AGAR|nr:hypothetical protein GYMLUDRAFT_204967 [Collybiopsis luxurians FD-317 M1]
MLPSTLLDFTLSRISTPRNLSGNGYLRRRLTNAALALKSSEPAILNDPAASFGVTRGRRKPLSSGALKVRDGTNPSNAITSELAQRVRALEKVTDEKDAEFEPPFFSEQDLMTFYEDILAHPGALEPVQSGIVPEIDVEARYREDLAVVEAVDQRLRSSVNQPSRLTMALRQEFAEVPEVHAETSQDGATPVYQRVVNHIQSILGELDQLDTDIKSSDEGSTPLSLALLSMEEWGAALRCSLYARDTQTAEGLIELMKRSNLEVPEHYVNDILQLYVEDSNCVGFESSLSKLVQGPASEQQRHLHIKVHLNATPTNSIPSSALSVLHAYENQSLLPAMKTYSTVIRYLFSVHDSISQAQAWDLFSHMRYVAHPTPDAHLYTQMIRACASPFITSRSSDPERALDLWMEMTIDHNISPTSGTWNAVILACARSGRKAYVHEAFRLAKEMLDSHRDAYGHSAYTPDERTFCALLEGAKRTGDLARARWIFAEMVRSRNLDVKVNEEAMMHVLHAYASYRPPFKRSLARIIEDESSSSPEIKLDTVDATEPSASNTNLPTSGSSSAFTHVPPQSSTEVIAEVEVLFNRLLRETGVRSDVSFDDNDVFQDLGKFSGIKLTTRLINSYLSVHYRHNSLHTSRDLFWRIFEEVGVERDGRTYMEALERCASSKKVDRDLALRFAEELFEKWRGLEGDAGQEISPRVIERAHVAFIRILTLAENLDRAIAHLHAFVDVYPASAVRDLSNIIKPSMRATRTSLVGDRPLVRLTSQVEIPDRRIPPLLTWKDLEVLHHRLVADGRRERDISYVKYVCKAYEWALRVRRDETMRAKPGTGEDLETDVEQDGQD